MKKNEGFVNKTNVKKENISVSVLRHESSELQWFVLHEKGTVYKD